jgi:O-antigen ligase
VRESLTPLLFFQRFFLPSLLAVLAWAIWRTVRHKDQAVGLALYLGLVIVVDGFMNTGIYIPGLEKGSIRYSELCAVLLFMHRPPAGAAAGGRRPLLFLVAAYFALLFGSALRSDSVVSGIYEFRAIMVPQIVAVLIAIRGFPSRADYRRFVLSLTAVAFVIALFDFWDIFFDRWLLHSDTLFSAKYWVTRSQGRFGSVFLNPNMMGAFTVLVFPAVFVSALNESYRSRRLYAWLGLLALLFCLVETQSRGPMLAFAIGLSMLVIGPCGGAVSRSRRFAFLAVFIVLFTVFMPGFYDHAVERFADIDREMTTEEGRTRETVWLYAGQMISDHPVAGIGFGEKQFLLAMDRLGFGDRYKEESLDNPHNSYLQMAVYAGIPALAVFVLANVVLLWGAAVVSWRNADERTTQSVFGLAVGIAGFLAVIYPDMHMFTQAVAPIYWVFFGLLLSLTAAASQAARAAAQEQIPRPVPVLPRAGRDLIRAAAPDAGRSREGQMGPVAPPFGVRAKNGRGEVFPPRSADGCLTRDAGARRQRR